MVTGKIDFNRLFPNSTTASWYYHHFKGVSQLPGNQQDAYLLGKINELNSHPPPPSIQNNFSNLSQVKKSLEGSHAHAGKPQRAALVALIKWGLALETNGSEVIAYLQASDFNNKLDNASWLCIEENADVNEQIDARIFAVLQGLPGGTSAKLSALDPLLQSLSDHPILVDLQHYNPQGQLVTTQATVKLSAQMTSVPSILSQYMTNAEKDPNSVLYLDIPPHLHLQSSTKRFPEFIHYSSAASAEVKAKIKSDIVEWVMKKGGNISIDILAHFLTLNGIFITQSRLHGQQLADHIKSTILRFYTDIFTFSYRLDSPIPPQPKEFHVDGLATSPPKLFGCGDGHGGAISPWAVGWKDAGRILARAVNRQEPYVSPAPADVLTRNLDAQALEEVQNDPYEGRYKCNLGDNPAEYETEKLIEACDKSPRFCSIKSCRAHSSQSELQEGLPDHLYPNPYHPQDLSKLLCGYHSDYARFNHLRNITESDFQKECVLLARGRGNRQMFETLSSRFSCLLRCPLGCGSLLGGTSFWHTQDSGISHASFSCCKRCTSSVTQRQSKALEEMQATAQPVAYGFSRDKLPCWRTPCFFDFKDKKCSRCASRIRHHSTSVVNGCRIWMLDSDGTSLLCTRCWSPDRSYPDFVDAATISDDELSDAAAALLADPTPLKLCDIAYHFRNGLRIRPGLLLRELYKAERTSRVISIHGKEKIAKLVATLTDGQPQDENNDKEIDDADA